MGWLSKLFAGNDDAPAPEPALDVETRRRQLAELDDALTALIQAMSEPPSPLNNPGWQGKLRDYAWVRHEVRELTNGTITHDGLYALILGVQPVFRGEVPNELAFIGPLQDRVLAATKSMQGAE